MKRRLRKSQALNLRSCLVLWVCSLAASCEPDEPWDPGDMMVGSARSDASTSTGARDAGDGTPTNDTGVVTPGTAGGNASGGNASGGNASGGSAGGGSAGGGAGGGNTAGGADASGPASNLDAGTDWTNADANASGVMVGPSRRRDGGPPRWDPDAAGPILDPEMQAACLTLTDNICNRVVDCRASLAGMTLTEAQRKSGVESCRESIWVAHNCNRAIQTSSDFAICAESTKTADCSAMFMTDFGESCFDKISFQR